MILNILCQNSSYGYEITNTIRSLYPINESSVYTALRELSEEKLVTCQFVIIKGKLRKYYSIASDGRETLKQHNPICRKQLCDILNVIAIN